MGAYTKHGFRLRRPRPFMRTSANPSRGGEGVAMPVPVAESDGSGGSGAGFVRGWLSALGGLPGGRDATNPARAIRLPCMPRELNGADGARSSGAGPAGASLEHGLQPCPTMERFA